VNFGLCEGISDSDGFCCHLGCSSLLMYVCLFRCVVKCWQITDSELVVTAGL